jgi:hypothetical protein
VFAAGIYSRYGGDNPCAACGPQWRSFSSWRDWAPYIYFVESEKPAPGLEPNEKVFSVESDKIQEVRVTAGGATTVLAKKDTGWQITEPMATDADPTEASSLVTNLASLETSRVIDENPSDLAPYGSRSHASRWRSKPTAT